MLLLFFTNYRCTSQCWNLRECRHCELRISIEYPQSLDWRLQRSVSNLLAFALHLNGNLIVISLALFLWEVRVCYWDCGIRYSWKDSWFDLYRCIFVLQTKTLLLFYARARLWLLLSFLLFVSCCVLFLNCQESHCSDVHASTKIHLIIFLNLF